MAKIRCVIEDAAGEISLNREKIEFSFNIPKDSKKTFGGILRITPKILKHFIILAKKAFKDVPEFPNEHFGFDFYFESDIFVSISKTELSVTHKWANGRLSHITCKIGEIEEILNMLLKV